MKYPTRIIFELNKKKQKSLFRGLFIKHISSFDVFVNFKQRDSRSGIKYKIFDIIDYGKEFEIKLIRADHKDE